MMMRRKPYAELPGVGLSVGKKATPEPPRSSPAPLPMRAAAPAPRNSPGMKPETVRKFTAEIRNLSLLLDQPRLKTDADGQKMCSYTEEKLAQAASALDHGDGEASWFSLFGAAKLCKSFQIQPEKSERALHRIKGLLSEIGP